MTWCVCILKESDGMKTKAVAGIISTFFLLVNMSSVVLAPDVGWKKEFWVQGWHPNCGAASASMILKWASYPEEKMPTLEDIREKGGTEPGEEMTTREVRNALRRYGVECTGWWAKMDVATENLKKFIDKKQPVMILEKVNSAATYEVVHGYNETGVFLCVPGAWSVDYGWNVFKDWETLEEKWDKTGEGYAARRWMLQIETPQCYFEKFGSIYVSPQRIVIKDLDMWMTALTVTIVVCTLILATVILLSTRRKNINS